MLLRLRRFCLRRRIYEGKKVWACLILTAVTIVLLVIINRSPCPPELAMVLWDGPHEIDCKGCRNTDFDPDMIKIRTLRMRRGPSTAFSFPRVQEVSCPLLQKGDSRELHKAMSDEHVNRTEFKDTGDYVSGTYNCTDYVLKNGFGQASVSDTELDFPLAFSMLVYRDADQVERLLRAVYRPHNVYCIHVDRKSDWEFKEKIQLFTRCLPNVFLAQPSVDVKWAFFTNLLPELICLKMLWSHFVRWRYFINLTGQEFPLKTNKELVQILKAFKGANDIAGTHDPAFKYRWDKFLPAPHNLNVSKGAVHIAASRNYVNYVIHSRVARDFLQWLCPAENPDESFFNTLNHNPQLGVPGSYLGAIEDRNKTTFTRHVVWLDDNPDECAGKWVRDVCHFGAGDLPQLVTSSKLFANKFSYDYQPLAYDCLEEWYWRKVELENKGRPQTLNVSLYEHSDIVKLRYRGPVLLW